MAATDAIIELREVYKYFGAQKVLDGLSLRVPRGKTTVIIGRSGGGKSVILKHMIGLIKPDRGQVLVDGRDLKPLDDRELNDVRKRFGMLFQDAALFDSMSVYENVAFPLREHTRLGEKQIGRIVEEKLALVGLSGHEAKMPSQLSGGMRKRAGLARAIALEPEIILFDEPTTGLDPLMTDAINRLIKTTQERLGVTAVVISHDIQGAYEVAHQMAMLYLGRIIATGPPHEIRDSQDAVVQQFIHGRAEGPIEVL
ncbi:MAG: ABC transporter ATP-binding protein [Thermodesulfobacteriota bacterium]